MARIAGKRSLLTRSLPRPPGLLRQGPFREGRFTSRLHDTRTAALLGAALGISFSVCFLTGLFSHYLQHPPSWYSFSPRPVWLYRLTQGLHVATGLASVPLLLVKLWTVYPRFWGWPPVRSVAHALERASLLPLVGGAIFQLTTGIANIAQWYPFHFFFTVTHYWVAWITMGALAVHVSAKAVLIRESLGPGRDRTPEPAGAGLSRRGLLAATGIAAGAVTLVTVGQTVPGLGRLALLAPRRPDLGPQGLPVNKSASRARVLTTARDADYRLVVDGPRALSLRLDDVRAMPQYTVSLPITCVEGWSADAHWTGVRLRDLLDRAGIGAGVAVRVESLEKGGLYRTSEVAPAYTRDELTLLALQLNGADLHLDHGYPIRLIAPDRPGVLQTKWVHRVVAL